MKRLARAAAIGLAIVLLGAIALPFLIDPNDYRTRLEAALGQSLGREVTFGDLKLAIFSGSVTARDLSIAEDPSFGRTPFVRARSLRIGVELWPLITARKLNVTGITIDQPEIQLIQAPSGEWNFASLGGKAAAAPKSAEPASDGRGLGLSVKLVKIRRGRFSLGRVGGRFKPLTLDAVDLEVRDWASTSSFPFSLSASVAGGGEIQLDGKAGPLDPGNTEATPVRATLKIARFDLSGSGWTQATPGVGGIVGFEGSVESNGSVAQMKGRLKADKLRFASNGKPADRTVDLDFAAEHNLNSRAGRLTRGEIHIGKATASLTGTYGAQGETTRLRLNLSGPDMPVPELASMLPAMGIALPAGSSLQGGTASVKLALEGLSTNLVTSGSVAFKDTKLSGFDLGRKMAVVQALAGIKSGPDTEIRTLSTNIRMSNEGIFADGMELVAPAIGELRGAGTISPSNALDFRMTALVHTSGLMAAIRDAQIPFLVGGTAADPVFRPDVRAVVTEKAKTVGTKAVQGLLNRFLGSKKN